jgi:hypothetical protein
MSCHFSGVGRAISLASYLWYFKIIHVYDNVLRLKVEPRQVAGINGTKGYSDSILSRMHNQGGSCRVRGGLEGATAPLPDGPLLAADNRHLPTLPTPPPQPLGYTEGPPGDHSIQLCLTPGTLFGLVRGRVEGNRPGLTLSFLGD